MLLNETATFPGAMRNLHSKVGYRLVKRMASAALLTVTFGAFSPMAFAQATPICLNPPPIGGTPAASQAPVGWSVASNSPDIIAGNGPWPGGGYTVSDVTGTSTSGGSMGLFLNEGTSYVESWATTLTGLTAGQSYQVAIEWQQATLAADGGGTSWSGGMLRMSVDGNVSDYTSTGTVAGDSWQVATKTFVATGPTAVLELGKTPTAGLSGMVVADSGAACSIIGPGPSVAAVPALSVFGAGGIALSAAMVAAFALRSRRRRFFEKS